MNFGRAGFFGILRLWAVYATGVSNAIPTGTEWAFSYQTRVAGRRISVPRRAKRLKELERENAKLKRLVAELSLERQILEDVASENL